MDLEGFMLKIYRKYYLGEYLMKICLRQMHKNSRLNKILASTIISMLIISSLSVCFAQGPYDKYKETHRKLCEVVKLSGIPEYSEPDDKQLAYMVDRTGILTVLKILGYEAAYVNMDKEEVNLILSKFTDENQIPDWARNAIAYGVKKEIIHGISKDKIGIKESFNGKMLSAIVLNALGYKINAEEYKIGCSILAEKGGLTVDQALQLNDKKLNYGELIEMSYSFLKAKGSDNKTVIEKLIEANGAFAEKAKEYGLIEME